MIKKPKKLKLEDLKRAKNIVPLLDSETLAEVAREVIRGYDIDEDSRTTWRSNISEATDLAMQVMEDKDFPWEGASNIKYPLIAEAAIDFASRAGPEILKDGRIVKGRTVGADPDGTKWERSERVSEYMSYDLTCKSPDWVEGTDKLLQILPILGTVFKKTYYNEIERRICSDLCLPHNIVVNFGAQSLDAARRVTHVLKFHKNDIISRQRKGLFITEDASGKEIDLCSLAPPVYNADTMGYQQPPDELDPELQFLEQQCFFDLDGDGYREPYVVTAHRESGIVFRIKARFQDIEYNSAGSVVRITPVQYFTDYHFIRSFDGGFYSIGFGILLLPLNKAINTLFNMLIDSGTLNTLQGGIIGSGIRLKNGELKFKMGRWQNVSLAAGEEIAKNIFPWPTKEPSSVLFQLLGMLIQIGKEFTSTTDVMQGNQPAQNVSSNTISQLIEQGSKTNTNINKRVYRSLTSEYRKIYYLNYMYLSNKDYQAVLDNPDAIVKQDFDLYSMDVYPVADPSLATETQRIMKATAMLSMTTANKREAELYLANTMQIDKDVIAKIFPEKQDPQPEMLKMQAEMQKVQAEIANLSAQATLRSQEVQLMQLKFAQEQKFSDAQIQYYQALIWQIQQNAAHNLRKDMIVNDKMQRQEGLKQAIAQNKAELSAHAAALDEIKVAHEIVNNTDNNKEEPNG